MYNVHIHEIQHFHTTVDNTRRGPISDFVGLLSLHKTRMHLNLGWRDNIDGEKLFSTAENRLENVKKMHLFSPAAARNLLTSTLWPKHTQHQPGHLSTEPVFRYLHLANCKNCTVQCCKTLNNTFSTKIVKLKFDLFIWQFEGKMTTVSRVLCLCAAVSNEHRRFWA